MQRLSLVVEAVPDREGHPEEPLAADQPVALQPTHPVLVAVPHEVGHPGHLPAALDERLTQRLVAAPVADVPLPAGDDLERLVALLVEVDHPGGRCGLAVEVPGGSQSVDHCRASREGGLPSQLRVRRCGSLVGQPLGRLAEQPAVPADHGAGRQVQLAPPGHVGQVAEGAAHRDAGALVRLGQVVGHHRHLHAEQRGAHRRTEERLVALVVRVGDQCHARRDQLGAGGLNENWLRTGPCVLCVERDPVVSGRGTRGPRAPPARQRSGRSRPTGSAPRAW